MMDENGWVRDRSPRWQTLERLLTRVEEGGLRALRLEEARALARHHREVSGDLLRARARGLPAEVTGYLNDLVGRAYALTAPRRRMRWHDIWRFYWLDLPELIRRERWMILGAAALMLAGGLFGWLGMAMDPEAAPFLIPEDHLSLEPILRAQQEAEAQAASVDEQAAFATWLFTHNIQVSFLAFALGITAGVGTGVVLFFNGVFLGGLAQVYAARGLAGWFWAWILPHGIPELTAIFLAGAAGLILGRGLIAPRGLPRSLSLRQEATVALRLLLATLPILVVAGIIEGTISQIHPPQLPVGFKISFALVMGGALYLWLGAAWLRGPGALTQSVPRALSSR